MRRIILLLTVAAIALPVAARADHTPDALGCPIHLSDLSASNPNMTDQANDWDGVVTGNGTATVPTGDIYREGADITAIWFGRDTAGGIDAHIQVANLSELQPNAIFYFVWTYEGSDATRKERFVSARLKGYTTAYSYGYVAASDIPTSSRAYRTEGDTTGRIVAGAPGELVIDIPAGGTTFSGGSNDDWGAPALGSVLDNPIGSATILAGSPEPLPENPAGLRHGFVQQADITDEGACGAYVTA